LVLDEVTRRGWVLAAVVEPAAHLEALAMVVDGQADVIIATRPEYMPALQFAYDLSGRQELRRVPPGTANAAAYARPVPRSEFGRAVAESGDRTSPRLRRPQRLNEPEIRTAATDFEPEFRRAVAESGTPMPNRAAVRRVPGRRARVVAQDRGRRSV